MDARVVRLVAVLLGRYVDDLLLHVIEIFVRVVIFGPRVFKLAHVVVHGTVGRRRGCLRVGPCAPCGSRGGSGRIGPPLLTNRHV